MSPTVLHAVRRRRRTRRRPWRASSSRRRVRARACLRSSSSDASARRHILDRALQSRGRCSSRADDLRWRACARRVPVSASSRRTPAATPQSDEAVIRPMSPVRLTCVPPHSSTDQPSVLPRALAHGDDADLVAVFLAEQRARAGSARIVERHQARRHRRVLQHEVVGDVLDAARVPPPSSAWDARSRSAAGRARPASPSARRDRRAPGAAPRAADASRNGWRGWRCGARDRRRARAATPSLSVPSSTVPMMHEQIAGLLLRIGDAKAHALARHHAGVADLAAGLAIERRLVERRPRRSRPS